MRCRTNEADLIRGLFARWISVTTFRLMKEKMSSPRALMPAAAAERASEFFCSGWMSGDKEPVMAPDCAASGLPAEQKIKIQIFCTAGSPEAQRSPGRAEATGRLV